MQACVFTLFTCVILYGSTLTPEAVRASYLQRCTERSADESSLPVAAYDASEPSDPHVRERRRAVGASYDRAGFVSRDASRRISGSSLLLEGWPNFPALPASQSDAVVIGEVIDAAAYLSNDRSNIYTELRTRIDEVLKWGEANPPASGDLASVSRVGGVVLYPNGHKRYYVHSGWGMPRSGRRYVLFLVRKGDGTVYHILTGYELKEGHVIPLDHSGEFDRFSCRAEDAFLSELRAAVRGEGRNAPEQ